MIKGAVDHVLLTRFNLPTQGVESLVRARDGWLRQRIELFDRYTVPSVRSQTIKTVNWLVYLDPASPPWLLDRVNRHADAGAFTPVFRTAVSRSELLEDIRTAVRDTGRVLITTNLDNDDGLAADFVERIQAVRTDHRTAVYLSQGLVKSEGALFLNSDPNNAFCSVVEPWDDPATCWSDWHNLLHLNMPTVALDGSPAWLQVIHGGNVSNRVRGRLVSPTPYTELFPGLLEDVPTPGVGRLARDRVVGRPKRLATESSRQLAKSTAMRILGKHGFDRLKWTVASARKRHVP